MKTKQLLAGLAALFLVLLSGMQTGAQEEIKARMRDRLPEILSLKERGIVGETNGGLLAFVGAEKAGEDLVQAENLDRQQVYAAIARQQGVTPEFVGQRRARQIAEQAPAGFWLQDESGSWYQKP